jgi:ABC-type transport system involved in multi-copper enzyme maturation permease subunit
MKFFAILKDSLRETLDVKLFYVLVGLSLLVILFVGSITYKPEPMETEVKPMMSFTAMAIQGELNQRKETRGLSVKSELTDFMQLDPAREPWESDHRFKLTLTLSVEQRPRNPFFDDGEEPPPALDPEKERQAIAAGKESLVPEHLQHLFKKMLFFVNDVDVAPVAAAEASQTAFEVTTRGSKIKSRKEWFHKPALFFGLVEVPVPLMTLASIVVFIGDWIVGTFGNAVIMFLSTIMTASFLPNMLTRGTVDLLIVKPIRRTALFIYKFLGGLLFMFLNTAIIMGGIWLALGVQTGLWINAFLLCILIYTFQFMIFYSVSALAAVLTRSAIVAILMSVMLWVLLFGVAWTHWFFIEKGRDARPPETTSHWAYIGYDTVHAVLPRYKDLDWLTARMIREELVDKTTNDSADRARAIEKLDKEYGSFHWGTSLAGSSVFVIVVVGLACLRFATKDY